MKDLIDVCARCKYLDSRSDFPNLWCDKIVATLNGLSVADMASAGCDRCSLELKAHKAKVKESIARIRRNSSDLEKEGRWLK